MLRHASEKVHVLLADIVLRCREVRVTEDSLNIGQAEGRIASHQRGSCVSQIMKANVRSEIGVEPTQDGPGRVIGQRSERSPQRPPDG